MPRTKQHRKGKRQSTNFEEILRDFNRLAQMKIHEKDEEIKRIEENFDTATQCALKRFPPEIQSMTLHELFTIVLTPVKENLPLKTPKTLRTVKKASMKLQKASGTKRVTAVSDDGYQSESAASQASKFTSSARPKRRSRSTSRDPIRQRSMSRDRNLKPNIASTQKKKELMKTPSTKTTNDFVITPKIKLNSAMNVLRKPKDGEMVFSTQGSPLMVSTTVNDRTANINVPLRNGNIISLLPFHETSLSDNLYLDDETKNQLKILQSHLAKVLN